MDSTAATGLPLHGIPTQSMMHPWTLCVVRSHKLPHLTMDEHAAGQLGSRPHFQVRFGHLRIRWSHAAISASLCSSSWVILVFLRVRIWFDWFDFFCASWLLWFTMGPLLSMAYRYRHPIKYPGFHPLTQILKHSKSSAPHYPRSCCVFDPCAHVHTRSSSPCTHAAHALGLIYPE